MAEMTVAVAGEMAAADGIQGSRDHVVVVQVTNEP
jgi:hypothetical protein